MTGIVVVAHSRALAEAAVALAHEMVHGSDVRIVVAAGLDATTLGTDAVAIMEAIGSADDGAGVVVLMDLGSAVLSAELALDLVDPEVRDRVLLCPAPLVEGLVVAAVSAASGAAPSEVAAEAVGALAAKQGHLNGPDPAGSGTPTDQGGVPPVDSGAPARTAVFEVANRHGLHARPAARLVHEARLFDAGIELRNLTTGAGPVPARSLSKVATLGALRGHQIEISVTGSQALEAMEGVLALAQRRFDEEEAPDPAPGAPDDPTAGGYDTGGPRPASPGIAIGPGFFLHTVTVEVPEEIAGDPTEEWRRVREAIALVRQEIQHTRTRAAQHAGETEARIFDAHLELIDDADLLEDVRADILDGATAPRAWTEVIGKVEAALAAVADPYLRARAADVRAVGQQVAGALLGVSADRVDGQGVLIADDLTPAQVATVDSSRVSGIVLASGSPTGHSAILARSRGIPTVVAAGTGVLALHHGTTVALDGSTGELFIDPSAEILADLHERDGRARSRAVTELAAAASPATTGDGVHVLVGANLGTVQDARSAAASGADLAGLVRTEFLFLGRDQAPDVAEQVGVYRDLAAAMGGRLTLRTLDVGGDKPLSYAPALPEANPFLGVRGIRLALAQRELLSDQLAAIVKVAHETPVSVMFPMVSTLDELLEARRLLDVAVAVVGAGRPEGLQVGIMVEVPATALKAAAFAPHVDFLSIGTNDLTQYALAAERGNPGVAGIADPLDPGVLQLIDAVCRVVGEDTLVAVCGELAADPAAARLLVALGVRELSVAPLAVPGIKQAVRDIAEAAGPDLVAACLAAPGPAEVRALLA